MMHPGHGINWRREQTVHLCTDSEVAGRMETEIALGVVAVEFLIEEEEGILCNHTNDVIGIEPGLEDICGDVTTKAARVSG